MPEGHGPDRIGQSRRALVIFGVTLAEAGNFIQGVAGALAAVIFAVAVVVFRAAAGALRQL